MEERYCMSFVRKLDIRRLWLRFAVMIVLALSLAYALPHAAQAASKVYTPIVRNETVTIKGLKKTQKILFVSDMHIVAKKDSYITRSTKKKHNSRIKEYTFSYGTTAKAWLRLAAKLDSYKANLIIFGGDMIDYCSEANIEILKKGLAKVHTPYILLSGNHEGNDWALTGWQTVYNVLANSGVYSVDTVLTRNMSGFRVLCINEYGLSISDSTLTQVKSFLKKGKKGAPVILFSHVPLQSGEHNYDTNAQKTISACYSTSSPVVASFSGHVHYYQVLNRRADLKQISLLPAYKQSITMITVKGTETAKTSTAKKSTRKK